MKLLQRVLSFFTKTAPNAVNEVPFVEDDYRQIELVPAENLDFLNHELTEIEAFARRQDAGPGYDEVFMRHEIPVALDAKAFRKDHFIALLTGAGLSKALIKDASGFAFQDWENGMSAYGDASLSVFFESDEGFIQTIWLSINRHAKGIREEKGVLLLWQMGEKMNLVLADWNSLEIVPLTDEDKVRAYLKNEDVTNPLP